MFENLKELLFGEPYEAKRDYQFPLPYKIQAIYLHYGLKQLKDEGVFQKLPEDLQKKWQRAAEKWWDVRVSAEDLDQIDDDSWARIANKLNLKWKAKVENEEKSDDISRV